LDLLGGGKGRRWRFAPHTAHNSLVLDAALVHELESAMAGPSGDDGAKACAILKLRERVRQVCVCVAP
jgi:hypothetical protein